MERGYRREILGKRKRKRARWSLDTEEKYWEKEKEKELGRWSLDTEEKYLEKEKEKELGGAWIQKRNIGKKKPRIEGIGRY